MRYEKITKFSAIMLLVAIVLFPLIMILIYNPAAIFFLPYMIMGNWIGTGLTVLGGITMLYWHNSNKNLYHQIQGEPFWSYLSLKQVGRGGINYTFASQPYAAAFSSANPMSVIKLKEGYKPKASLPWYGFYVAIIIIVIMGFVFGYGPYSVGIFGTIMNYATPWLIGLILTYIPVLIIRGKKEEDVYTGTTDTYDYS
jgi:hypothetical protein